MRKVLVSGANGFVGSNLIRKLLAEGLSVCALVHKSDSNLPENDNLSVIRCDASDYLCLQDELCNGGYDTFYYLAWEGSAGPQRRDYVLQLRNVQYMLEAMRMSKAIGCKRFVVAGTIMEHEIIQAVYDSDMSPDPAYIYGSAKATAHLMASSMATELGIDLLWAKITNAYGPGELSPRMVNTTIRKCIDGTVPEFTSATQNYDYVYIDDLVDAFYLIGESGKPHRNYVIGSSRARPLKEFLLEMQEAVAPDIRFEFGKIPYLGINLPLEVFDCSQLEEDTGYRAKVQFGEGCRRTRDWLISIRNE